MITQSQEPLTFEKVWLMFQETDKKFQETDKKFQETDKKIQETSEQMKETDKQMKETDKQMKETDKKIQETSEQIKETGEQMKETDKQMKETDRKLKELGIRHGGLSNNIGESVEDFFYYGFEKKPVIGKIRFKKIVKGMKTDVVEYDIALTNGKYVAVMEIKHKFHPNDLTKFIDQKLPLLKKEFPKFKDCKIIACIAGLVIPKATKDKANESGVYIFTQAGENIKTLNYKNFKPIEY